MNFKINFNISGESKLSNAAILDRITSVLQYKKYRILSTTMDTVTFDCNPWRLKWNFEPTQVSGGVFEVNPSADGQSVSLKYYFNLLYPLIFIIVFLFVIIHDKIYEALWFFGAFYAIAYTITIIAVRNKGRALLRDVLTEGIN
jgi:hypothetical protein